MNGHTYMVNISHTNCLSGKRIDPEWKQVHGIEVTASPKAWMNEQCLQEWLCKVWGTFSFSKRFLIWDSFRAHTMDSIKNQVTALNTVQAIIPGGCTSCVQPADVCWNYPFKTAYR
jgi:hypothetical protein